MVKNIKISKLCPKCGQPLEMQRKIWGGMGGHALRMRLREGGGG